MLTRTKLVVIAAFAMILTGIGAPSSAQTSTERGAQSGGSIFVTDIIDNSSSFDNATLDLFSEMVRDGTRKYATGYQLIDRQQVEVILEGFGTTLGTCLADGKDDCEVTFAERIQADIVVSGQIIKAPDGTFRMVVKMHDVISRSPMNSVMARGTGVVEIERALNAALPVLFEPLLQVGGAGTGAVVQVSDSQAGLGILSIVTRPGGAEITLNGTPTGQKTPHSFEALPPGEYKVGLDHPQSSVQRVVAVKPAEMTSLDIDLPVSRKGDVELESFPAGLMILFDGKEVGRSSAVLKGVGAGRHTVDLRGAVGGINYVGVAGQYIEVVDGQVSGHIVNGIEEAASAAARQQEEAAKARVREWAFDRHNKAAFLWNFTLIDFPFNIGLGGELTLGFWWMPSLSFGATIGDRWRLYVRGGAALTGSTEISGPDVAAFVTGVGLGWGVVLGEEKRFYLDLQVGYENLTAGGGWCSDGYSQHDRAECEFQGQTWITYPEHNYNIDLVFGWHAHGRNHKPYTNIGAGLGYHSVTNSLALRFILGFGN